MALPNIITNITIPLLGIIDFSLLGHLPSPVYLAAVSLGAMLFNILYWGVNFIRMSTVGFTAQAYGAGDDKAVSQNIFRPLMIALSIGVLFILLQSPIAKIGFYFLNGDALTEHLAAQYFYIRIWAAPASLSLYALYGWLIGIGNARYPMFIAITINVVNVLADYVLIYKFGLKSEGAAWGTLVAQYSGLSLGILLILKSYRRYWKIISLKGLLRWDDIRHLFKVNIDIFVRTLVMMLVFTAFTYFSTEKGISVLDANTLLFQFYIFFTYFMDGFAFAAESLTGQYVGARNKDSFHRFLKILFFYTGMVAVAFAVVYLIGGQYIVRLMTTQEAVLNVAYRFLPWVWLLPVLSFSAFVWDGVYVGMIASKQMRNVVLVSGLLVFFPLYLFLEPLLGNHALWMALLGFLTMRSVLQTILINRLTRTHFA